jgi:hypothetical protein
LLLASIPMLASLWAHLVLGEPYTWLHLAGMGLVLTAIEAGRRLELRRHTADVTTRAPAIDPSAGLPRWRPR